MWAAGIASLEHPRAARAKIWELLPLFKFPNYLNFLLSETKTCEFWPGAGEEQPRVTQLGQRGLGCHPEHLKRAKMELFLRETVPRKWFLVRRTLSPALPSTRSRLGTSSPLDWISWGVRGMERALSQGLNPSQSQTAPNRCWAPAGEYSFVRLSAFP